MDPNVLRLAMGAAGGGALENKLYAWGSNSGYVFGDGVTPPGSNVSSPIQSGSVTIWSKTQIGSGGWVIGIKTDGTLWGWGSNSFGQLGLYDISSRTSPVQIGSGTTWSDFCIGTQHVTAVKTDGTLWSWGRNQAGQLGLGDRTNRSSPIQIGTGTTWASVANDGYGHTSFAIKTDGTLWAWGDNYLGELGLSDTTRRSSPTQVGTGTNWSKIASGKYHTHAIKTDGTLWSWGYNYFGNLGIGNTTNYSSPKQVGSLTNWSKISAFKDGGAAIKTNGTLWTWGRNYAGQLGLGNTTDRSSPVQVGALTTWDKVSPGRNWCFAIKTDKTLWAWGLNNSGQLGLGNTTYYSSPKQVGSLTTWFNVSNTSGPNSSHGITQS